MLTNIFPFPCTEAKDFVHFIRSPTWIVPPRLTLLARNPKTAEVMNQIKVDEKGDFTPEQIEKFKTDPEFYKKFVKLIEQDVNSNFPIVSPPSLQHYHLNAVAHHLTRFSKIPKSHREL